MSNTDMTGMELVPPWLPSRFPLMDKAVQLTFRSRIQARLTEIETELADLQEDTAAVAPDVAIGRLSRLDTIQNQQLALANKRRLEDERTRLHEAERRIDAGSFGRCLLCGQDIAPERLDTQPDAVTCVPCARRKR